MRTSRLLPVLPLLLAAAPGPSRAAPRPDLSVRPAASPSPAEPPAAEPPPRPESGAQGFRVVHGTVDRVDRESARVTLALGSSLLDLAVDRNTAIFVDSRPGTLADLVPGVKVRASPSPGGRAFWIEVVREPPRPERGGAGAPDGGALDGGAGAPAASGGAPAAAGAADGGPARPPPR